MNKDTTESKLISELNDYFLGKKENTPWEEGKFKFINYAKNLTLLNSEDFIISKVSFEPCADELFSMFGERNFVYGFIRNTIAENIGRVIYPEGKNSAEDGLLVYRERLNAVDDTKAISLNSLYSIDVPRTIGYSQLDLCRNKGTIYTLLSSLYTFVIIVDNKDCGNVEEFLNTISYNIEKAKSYKVEKCKCDCKNCKETEEFLQCLKLKFGFVSSLSDVAIEILNMYKKKKEM